MKTIDVIIIGGGISGLHTAFELAKEGVDFKLIEARARFGGRIYSESGFDIGPSWIWPGQENIENLILELDLGGEIFEQFHQGDALFEPASGEIVRGVAGISMQGSYRMRGGLQTVIDALHKKIETLSPNATFLNSKIQKLKLEQDYIEVELENGETLKAKHIILALPPRVALQQIEFSPNLPDGRVKSLNKVATWMAGHAKAVVVYKVPFWRNAGLSGDVFSQRGPLSEIHDASSSDTFSLFGFLGTPPRERSADKALVDKNITEQLTRIFGEAASSPTEIFYKNWTADPLTATSLDEVVLRGHPANEWSEKAESSFDNRLIWSGTESANGPYNGYIEGAIVASHATVSLLKKLQ